MNQMSLPDHAAADSSPREPACQGSRDETPALDLEPPAATPPPAAALPFEPAANESPAAFQAFLCYFDIGEHRSYRRVVKLIGAKHGTLMRWASRFKWQERVRAYQTELLRARLAVQMDARRDQEQLRAERARLFQDAEWQGVEKLLRGAQMLLDRLLNKPPDKLTLADAARALEIASKIGRLATGLKSEPTTPASQVNVNLQLEIESAIQKVYGPIVDVEPVAAPCQSVVGPTIPCGPPPSPAQPLGGRGPG